MKTFLKLTAAAAALAGLTACDALGLGGNDNGSAGGNAANTVAGNATANASAGGKDPVAGGNNVSTASAPFTGQVTPQFIVGRWTDNGDCTQTIEFRDDGSFVTATGGTGYWTLNGDRLTFQAQRTITAQVSAPNANTIMLTQEDGSVGRSTRCT